MNDTKPKPLTAGVTSPLALRFARRVEELRTTLPRQEAMRQAIVEDPDGHQAFIADHNARHPTVDEARKHASYPRPSLNA
jgi:hypothetical protein